MYMYFESDPNFSIKQNSNARTALARRSVWILQNNNIAEELHLGVWMNAILSVNIARYGVLFEMGFVWGNLARSTIAILILLVFQLLLTYGAER